MGIFFSEESGQKLNGVCVQSPCVHSAVTYCITALRAQYRLSPRQGGSRGVRAAQILLLLVVQHRSLVGMIFAFADFFSRAVDDFPV